jgi:phosphomannomutase
MFTASHNPAAYNGIKLCRAGAAPISKDTGLADIERLAQRLLADGVPPGPADRVQQVPMLGDYAGYLRGLVDLRKIRPLRVVVDASNGMAGYTVPAVLGDTLLPPLPLTIDPLYFELDGTFPNHEANPLDPVNLVDLQHRVVESRADIGLAFDGDATGASSWPRMASRSHPAW